MQFRIAILALVFASCVACKAERDVPLHVAGQPVTFPVDARSYLMNYAEALQINCKSEDASIERACIEKMRRLAAECLRDEPKVFETRDQLGLVSKAYFSCLMPLPICKGREIRSAYHEEKYCKQSA